MNLPRCKALSGEGGARAHTFTAQGVRFGANGKRGMTGDDEPGAGSVQEKKPGFFPMAAASMARFV
jgi:hypothetical protein